DAYGSWRAPLRVHAFGLVVAPLRDDEFAVMAIGDAMRGESFPEITAGGFSSVWKIVVSGDAVQESAFGIVSMFVTAIGDGPGLCDIVGDGSGIGPDVAIAGDVATVVEIVENAELFSELVQVRSDVLAVHSERWVGFTEADVAENLIEGAIFLNHVNDVMDF